MQQTAVFSQNLNFTQYPSINWHETFAVLVKTLQCPYVGIESGVIAAPLPGLSEILIKAHLGKVSFV